MTKIRNNKLKSSKPKTTAQANIDQLIEGSIHGMRIQGFVESPDGEFMGLKLSQPGKPERVLWVEQDPEGNGPGFLRIHQD